MKASCQSVAVVSKCEHGSRAVRRLLPVFKDFTAHLMTEMRRPDGSLFLLTALLYLPVSAAIFSLLQLRHPNRKRGARGYPTAFWELWFFSDRERPSRGSDARSLRLLRSLTWTVRGDYVNMGNRKYNPIKKRNDNWDLGFTPQFKSKRIHYIISICIYKYRYRSVSIFVFIDTSILYWCYIGGESAFRVIQF